MHRWSGGPTDDWRPWLKVELEKLGYVVVIPSMPDTEVPVIEKWVSHLESIVGEANSDTYFVGHSIGCQTILRYLEKINVKVGGAIFVAGWFNLKNMEDVEIERIAEPWIKTPIDLVKIKAVLPKSTLIISDDDPFDCFEENREKFGKFVTNTLVIPRGGHLTAKDGFEELPQILEEMGI